VLDGLSRRFGAVIGSLIARAAAGERGEETVRPAASPEELWRVTVLPLPRSAGRVLLVMEDLSELARAERLSSFAELARIAAHEVKNPLTPIRLWAEELRAALVRGPDQVVAVAKVAAEQILERVEHLREVAQGFSNPLPSSNGSLRSYASWSSRARSPPSTRCCASAGSRR
jgi:nitrogen fixation/metabolism regulation signal transduction histidine kinase